MYHRRTIAISSRTSAARGAGAVFVSSSMVPVLILMLGCAGPPRSSVMTTEDYEHIATDIAAELKSNFIDRGVFAERNPDSPKMAIAITKVENLTDDLMSQGARWYLMSRVANSLPFQTLSRDRNVVFVIPADHLREAKKRGTVEEGFAQFRAPTHVMTATFRSVARSTGIDRTDLYYCEYAIESLEGELIWTDKVEFKRTAHGRAWD